MNKQNYDLTFLPLFTEDLIEIVDYITNTLKNPDAAHKLVDDVEQAIMERRKAPLTFTPYQSSKNRKYPYYRINIRNFSVFYVVIGNTMEVRRILYSKRNLDALLK